MKPYYNFTYCFGAHMLFFHSPVVVDFLESLLLISCLSFHNPKRTYFCDLIPPPPIPCCAVFWAPLPLQWTLSSLGVLVHFAGHLMPFPLCSAAGLNSVCGKLCFGVGSCLK